MEWVAHRGESVLAPENTLAAFELAWQYGADAVELDVHLTRDRQLIVCHDPDTLRTCGVAMTIHERTLVELRALDAGLWKGEEFRGQKLPLLAEVLATVPRGKRVLVEIKCPIDAASELSDAVAASRISSEQIAFLSFHPDVCDRVKRSLPAHRCCLLSELERDQAGAPVPPIDRLIEIAHAGHLDGLGLQDKPPIDARAVTAIHSAGLDVLIWTVDEPPRARELITLGIDGLISNRCSWLRSQIR